MKNVFPLLVAHMKLLARIELLQVPHINGGKRDIIYRLYEEEDCIRIALLHDGMERDEARVSKHVWKDGLRGTSDTCREDGSHTALVKCIADLTGLHGG